MTTERHRLLHVNEASGKRLQPDILSLNPFIWSLTRLTARIAPPHQPTWSACRDSAALTNGALAHVQQALSARAKAGERLAFLPLEMQHLALNIVFGFLAEASTTGRGRRGVRNPQRPERARAEGTSRRPRGTSVKTTGKANRSARSAGPSRPLGNVLRRRDRGPRGPGQPTSRRPAARSCVRGIRLLKLVTLVLVWARAPAWARAPNAPGLSEASALMLRPTTKRLQALPARNRRLKCCPSLRFNQTRIGTCPHGQGTESSHHVQAACGLSGEQFVAVAVGARQAPLAPTDSKETQRLDWQPPASGGIDREHYARRGPCDSGSSRGARLSFPRTSRKPALETSSGGTRSFISIHISRVLVQATQAPISRLPAQGPRIVLRCRKGRGGRGQRRGQESRSCSPRWRFYSLHP